MNAFFLKVIGGPDRARLDTLRSTLKDLTLKGEHYGSIGSIRYAHNAVEISTGTEEERTDRSALSSTYYAAAGHSNQLAAASQGVKWLKLKARAVWYLSRAVKHSDYLVALVDGEQKMTVGELTTRASIMLKARQASKALICINEAEARPDVSPDNRVLLCLNRVEACKKHGSRSLDCIVQAFGTAFELRQQVSPLTLVRFLRARAEWLISRGSDAPAKHDLTIALRLADEHKLDDQREKIMASIRRVSHVVLKPDIGDDVLPLIGAQAAL